MAEKNLKGLFLHTVKDVYYAEHEILKALPKMAGAAQHRELRAAFEKHRGQTEDRSSASTRSSGSWARRPRACRARRSRAS